MKVKRIGFDARLIGETGIGRYIKNLLTNISLLDPLNHYYIFLKPRDINNISFKNPNFRKIALDISWHSLKEQLIFPKFLNSYHLHLVHFPYFNVPLFYRGKYIVTIHDLIIDHTGSGRASTLPLPLYLSKKFFYKIVVKSALNKAINIIAISKSTKKEIKDHYGIPQEKIIVTYDALDTDFETLVRKHRPDKIYHFDYLLYVGNAYPHKNLERLIEVFEDPQINSRLKLVLAGADWFFYPRLKKIVSRQKLNNIIYFYGKATDRQLIDLYSHARALIIPSLMEGFGLPNLEAVSLGKLPLASDIPPFREIWGDNLLYFDPTDTSAIKSSIKIYLSLSEKTVNRKVAVLRSRLKRFSWQKTAQATLLQYQKI